MLDTGNNTIEQSNRRIAWIDIAKAVAMFLIVFGHIDVENDLQSIVYAFHIPTFIFLSGYCFSDKERFTVFLKKKLLRIMVPYVFFGLFAIAAYLVLGKYISTEGVQSFSDCLFGLLAGNAKSNRMGFNGHLWFLPCLFMMSVIFYGLKKLSDLITERFKTNKFYGYIGLFAVSMVVSAAILNYKTEVWFPFSTEIAIRNLPFFSLGFLVKSSGKINNDLDRKNKKEIILLAVIFVVSVLAMLFFVYKNIDSSPKEYFMVVYSRDFYGASAYFYGAAFFGIAAIVCFSRLLPAFKPLIYLGKNTIAVLVMQRFGVTPAKIIFDKLPQNFIIHFPAGVVLSVAVILMCLAVDLIIQKYFPFLYGMGYKKHQKKVGGKHET